MGLGRYYVGNPFALRLTKQKYRIGISDPLAPTMMTLSSTWPSKPPSLSSPTEYPVRQRGLDVALLLIEKAHVEALILRLTKDGRPSHPLYLPKTFKPVVGTRTSIFPKLTAI